MRRQNVTKLFPRWVGRPQGSRRNVDNIPCRKPWKVTYTVIRFSNLATHHYTSNSLSLFWLAEIFKISTSDATQLQIICRLNNNYAKDTRGHWQSCHARLRCMISQGNHVKFSIFCCLLSVKKQKHDFWVRVRQGSKLTLANSQNSW